MRILPRKKLCFLVISACILSDIAVWGNLQKKENVEFPLVAESEQISSPLLRELYISGTLQRLKKIDQSGPSHYFHKIEAFSRFSHSLGVLSLLWKYNCSLKEQAAGLMHDVSHTAFSHLGDYIFLKTVQEAIKDATYQDKIHLGYLKEKHIDKILVRYGLKIEDLDPEKKEYLALDQPLPNLCADRIEYVLHTALVTNKLTKGDVQEILDDLHFDGTRWFFTKPNLAKRLAELSLYYIKELWGAPWNIRMNIHFAEIIKRCFDLNVLTRDDLFLTDQEVLKKIQTYQEKARDSLIQLYWEQCEKSEEDLPNIQYKTIKIQPKFRGVDPLIKIGDSFVRLTSIDSEYKREFTETQEWCKKGYEVKVIIPPQNKKI